MPDFKGRKDFPEVDDKKIKIGDYSGTNRLSVVDIFSPKEKPELRDQMIEPIKGNKPNNYDSPMLSQQPIIVLSDDESEEATLIKAIGDVEDAVLIKAIETLEKRGFHGSPSARGGVGRPPTPREPGAGRQKYADSHQDDTGTVGRELAALKTQAAQPGGIPKAPSAGPQSKFVQGLTTPGSTPPKQEYGKPGPSSLGTAPKTGAEAAALTRRPAGVKWGEPGKPTAPVEDVSKAGNRRPPREDPHDFPGPKHPGAPERPYAPEGPRDDPYAPKGPKDDPYAPIFPKGPRDDPRDPTRPRDDPKHPGAPERPYPRPGKRDDLTLGKAAGNHIQKLIEDYLGESSGRSQKNLKKALNGVEKVKIPGWTPKTESEKAATVASNERKHAKAMRDRNIDVPPGHGEAIEKIRLPGRKSQEDQVWKQPKKIEFGEPKALSTRGGRDFARPGSVPYRHGSDLNKSGIDVSLLKDIADLLEKKSFGGLGGVITKPKTDSPSVPEPAKPSPSPEPETPAATPTPAASAATPTPATPTTTPSTPAATPDTPAATGGKMKGAGKRLGAGVKDFGTGFGEGFSGGTSGSGSGSGVNINIGGGGTTGTTAGEGGGATAPADTSAADDASAAASAEATGDYKGEPTTGPSATPPSTAPSATSSTEPSGVQRGIAPTKTPEKTPEETEIDAVNEELKNKYGWTDEQIAESRTVPEKPGIGSRVAQAAKGVGSKAVTAAGKVAAKGMGLDRAAGTRFASADISEEEEEAVKSWTYSG